MHFIVPSLPMYSFLRVWPTVNTLMMLKKDKTFFTRHGNYFFAYFDWTYNELQMNQC